MIILHRLGHAAEPFYLSPDLIVTIEANPDTVLTLTTGAKIVVNEAPEIVVQRMRRDQVGVLVEAAQARDEEREEGHPHGPGRIAAGDVLRVLDDLPRAVEAG
ncbi:MAG: flagellar FlbD family protein [Solirubrobacteraceae bacterium]|jgi:flagellar protein FlbD